MDYKKQQAEWLKRRITALAWVAAGMPRKDIAKRLKITRQRLSQIETEARKAEQQPA
jgi:transcriptional regulator